MFYSIIVILPIIPGFSSFPSFLLSTTTFLLHALFGPSTLISTKFAHSFPSLPRSLTHSLSSLSPSFRPHFLSSNANTTQRRAYLGLARQWGETGSREIVGAGDKRVRKRGMGNGGWGRSSIGASMARGYEQKIARYSTKHSMRFSKFTPLPNLQASSLFFQARSIPPPPKP